MTRTLRGFLAAVTVAVVLVVLALFTGGRPEVPPDRALAPGFSAEAVAALAWEGLGAGGAGSAAGGSIRIARDAASPTGWAWAAPPGAADARAVEDALAALRGGRWHRRGPAGAAGARTASLTVSRAGAGTGAGAGPAGAPLAVSLGALLPGSPQQWLVIGAHAYLVDAWLARALFPEPLSLRMRRPLAQIAAAAEVKLSLAGAPGPVVLAGSPRRLTAPVSLLLAPAVGHALEQALAALEIVELPRAPVAPLGEGIAADRIVVRDAGPCPGAPGRRAIDGTAGPGCIDAAAWASAQRAIAALSQPPAALVDRRPAPLDAARITLADGAVLDLAGRARLGDRDASAPAVLELLAALAAPGEPIAVPAGPPLGALTIADRHGRSIALDLHAGSIAVRRGEPVGLALGEGAFRLLSAPSARLVDPTPWREEPTTITSLQIDGTTYTRGAVLGEWTRTGPGRDAPATVEQLASALSAPAARAVPPNVPALAPRHTITLHVRPPGGAAVARTLRLGDPIGPDCPALLGPASGSGPGPGSASLANSDARIALPAEVCALVRALVR